VSSESRMNSASSAATARFRGTGATAPGSDGAEISKVDRSKWKGVWPESDRCDRFRSASKPKRRKCQLEWVMIRFGYAVEPDVKRMWSLRRGTCCGIGGKKRRRGRRGKLRRELVADGACGSNHPTECGRAMDRRRATPPGEADAASGKNPAIFAGLEDVADAAAGVAVSMARAGSRP